MRYNDDYYYETRSYRRYRRNRLHRAPEGIIFGVCEGISEWSGIPVGIIRVIAIIAFCSSGFFPVGVLYLLGALFLPVM